MKNLVSILCVVLVLSGACQNTSAQTQCKPEQTFKLLAEDGAASDQFGRRLAINGNIAVVGADLNDDSGTDSGSAYLFDTTTGQQIAKLLAEEGAADDRFGVFIDQVFGL